MGVKFGNKVIDKIYIGDREISNVYLGDKEIYTSFVDTFIDTSGSPGATYPINDLDGNIMASLEKGIAYYGTVSHTDLYTGDELASAVGVTAGNSINNQEVWHKYYWNGGIHFWRVQCRWETISWDSLANAGVVYGTGTTTSRKGYSGTNVNQNAEVTKNGVTYAVRLMEGANVDSTALSGSNLFNSEFSLILMNLHKATNTGSYVRNDSLYSEWSNSTDFTNDDFVGWKTNIDDQTLKLNSIGARKMQQETSTSNTNQRISRGQGRLSFVTAANSGTGYSGGQGEGWAPVLTVKHSSFTYE